MGALAFFPWIRLATELSVGGYSLLPFDRKRETQGDDSHTVSLLISRYRDHSAQPVRAAVLLSSPDRGLLQDFAEADLADVFFFAELVAFSGLAARQFFSFRGYSNRDHFRLVVQPFLEPERGVTVTTRRRDGSSTSFHTGDVYRVQPPPHVLAEEVSIDDRLLGSLLAATGRSEWQRLYQSIVLFNEANTDRMEMPEGAELTMSYAALEQLLGLAGESPRAVANRFLEHWISAEPSRDKWRIGSSHPRAVQLLAKSSGLRDAWVQDFANSRGSIAHGHHAEAYPAVWSPREHLLFAAFAIPRLLKLLLSEMGLYELSADDRLDVDVFAFLLNARHFAQDSHGTKSPWENIVSSRRDHRWAQEAADRVFGTSPGAATDPMSADEGR